MSQLVRFLLLSFLATTLFTSVSDAKKLPKKIIVPEGFIPADPTKIKANERAFTEAEIEAQNILIKDQNFQGVIQFISGEVTWVDANQQPDPQYKTILKKGEALKVGNNSYVKIITHKRCIGIAYGPAVLTAPKSKEDDTWYLENASLRWICPGKSEEKLSIDNKPLTMYQGEIFYHKGKLLVIAGEPEATNNSLESKKLYSGKSAQWRALKNQPHEHALWQINQELPTPKESLIWSEPDKPRKYRFSFGPHLGAGFFNYNSDQIKDKIPSEFKGGRFAGYFHANKKVYTLSATFIEHDKNFDNGQYSQVQFNSINIGSRLDPDAAWSLNWRIGLGSTKLKTNYSDTNGSYGHALKYGLLTLAGGIDRIFTFHGWNWLGLIISAEAQLSTTLGAPEFEYSYGSALDPHKSTISNSALSSVDFIIHAGPLIYF